MAQMVVGVFSSRENAENAIEELRIAGYDPKQMSVVMKDSVAAKQMAENTGADVASGAVAGATTGTMVGALAGLLIGIGAITVPGIGGLLIGGPLAAALGLSGAAATTVSGAVTGALAGGLIGALTSIGIPEKDARVYEEKVRLGGVLVMVPVRGEDHEIRETFGDNDADQIKTVNTNERFAMSS